MALEPRQLERDTSAGGDLQARGNGRFTVNGQRAVRHLSYSVSSYFISLCKICRERQDNAKLCKGYVSMKEQEVNAGLMRKDTLVNCFKKERPAITRKELIQRIQSGRWRAETIDNHREGRRNPHTHPDRASAPASGLANPKPQELFLFGGLSIQPHPASGGSVEATILLIVSLIVSHIMFQRTRQKRQGKTQSREESEKRKDGKRKKQMPRSFLGFSLPLSDSFFPSTYLTTYTAEM